MTSLIVGPMRFCKIKYCLIAPTLVRIAPSIEARHQIAICVHPCRFQRCVACTHDRLAQIVEAVMQALFRPLVFPWASFAAEGDLEL